MTTLTSTDPAESQDPSSVPEPPIVPLAHLLDGLVYSGLSPQEQGRRFE